MSKTFLVEFTEKEIEAIQQFMTHGWLNSNFENVTRTEKEKLSETCKSAHGKLIESLKEQKDALITSQEFFHIKSGAKEEYLRLRNDLYLSSKKVEEKDFVHIALANSVIMWLNGNGLLKKLVKFDYTDHSAQYEELEE